MNHPVPVVFIHGTRTSSAIWEEQERFLQEQGHLTRAIDLPGHGKNLGGVFTLEETFTILDDAVSELGGQVLLVGLSLGGYLALAYAADHPDKVVGVMAAGCSTETSRFAVRAYRAITASTTKVWRYTRKHLTKSISASLPNPMKASWDVVTQMLAVVGRLSSLSNLKAVTSPVMLISGQYCPLRLGEKATLRTRPDVQHVVVPKVGHDVNTHAPSRFNRAMMQMLQSIPA